MMARNYAAEERSYQIILLENCLYFTLFFPLSNQTKKKQRNSTISAYSNTIKSREINQNSYIVKNNYIMSI